MKEIQYDKENVNLLWTGGWDSTFQLLQLLIIQRCQVTPFYLLDEQRMSTGVEILTIKRIKNRLLKDYPHTRELLQPTKFFSVADISPDSEITEAYQSILKEKFIGCQYDWIPRFCKESGVTDMQLCIHRDDKAHFVLDKFVRKNPSDCQEVFQVDQKFEETNEYAVFRYFSFPIFQLSKIQMSAIAKKQGWENIMGLTWFCHAPRINMKPCGVCNPCLYTLQEGLGWRIPRSRRMALFYHKQFIRPAKSLVKIVLGQLGLLSRS